MNRGIFICAIIALSGCVTEPVTLNNPITGASVTLNPQGYAERRAQVELAVKSRYPEVLTDIAAGGGPALTAAFDAAAVPVAERPARVAQMQGDLGLFQTNIDALILQLVLFGA